VESFLMVPGAYENPVFRLYSKLTPEAVKDFAYVIIDTPPSMGPLMMNALGASDLLIAPMESGSGFSFDGIEDLLKIVTLVKKEQLKSLPTPHHTDLQLLGILLTKHDKRQTLCKEVQRALVDRYQEDVFTTTIAASAAVKKAEFPRETLMQNDRKSTAARHYMQLAEEVLLRIRQREAARSPSPTLTAEPQPVGA
jgi:chromosome partitioning protein